MLTHEMKVTIVVFDRKALELSESLIGGIEQFIDDHTALKLHAKERDGNRSGMSRRRRAERDEEPSLYSNISGLSEPLAREETIDADEEPALAPMAAMPDLSGKSLDEILGDAGDSFQQRLLKLIDKSGMDDVTVYKKANIDRKVFSRIRCKPDYKPKKKTALAFAIALELDMPTMTDLLSRAEIALSPSNTFDLIITYFITNKNYDIFEINAALFKYGQPILGE